MIQGNRVLILIVAALIPVVVLATGWIADVAHLERARLERSIFARTERVRDQVDAMMRTQISALQALASSEEIDSGDLAGLRRELLRATADHQLWKNIILIGPDKHQVLNAHTPDRHILVTSPGTVGHVFQTGVPAVTPIMTGRASGYVTAGMVVPVKRDGAVRYALSAVLDVGAFGRRFQESLPKGWAGIVVDREGHIVVRGSDGATEAGQQASDTAVDSVAEGREGVMRRGVSRTGVPVLVTYLTVPGTGWTVHIGVPMAELSPLQNGTLRFAEIGGALGLALAALFAWLLVRELRQRRREAAALAEHQHLEAIGRLTGGIAHDFNNLLMIVQSAALGLQKRANDPVRVAGYADGILAAAGRGAALTKQLLGYARRERQQPVSFDLQERASDLLTLLKHSSRGDIETALSVGEHVWPIFADPNALEVALINLATNARDAMPEGGRLAVSASNVRFREDQDGGTGLQGDFVAIAVRDTGMGIAPKNLAHIFQPFFTTKEAGQGTGLGLAQVHGFARQSGGAVTVASAPGKGTTFTLYLPRAHEPAAPARVVSAAAPPQGLSGRVLLIEDNAEVGPAIERMLEGVGLTFATVTDAPRALRALESGERFDFVLSDIVLGSGMSGLDLEAELRASHPDLPVILMTGYSDALARGTARGLDVLNKPFSEADMIAAFQRAAVGAKPFAAVGAN